MKKSIQILSTGNEWHFYFDGKKHGGYSSKKRAEDAAKEMNRARYAGGKKKLSTGITPKVDTGPIRMGNTRLFDRKRSQLNKSEIMTWQEILKKKPSRSQRKKREYTYKVPKGVYDNPKLRAKIHRRLWAKNTHGTGKYQWSGRKSQELNRLYQKEGGGFVK